MPLPNMTFDIRNEVQYLNEAERIYLVKYLQDPVFIKYLRNKVLELTLETSLREPNSTESDTAFRIKNAHDTAYIRAYNDLLSDIQKPGESNGTSNAATE